MTGFGNTADEETQMIVEPSITEVSEDFTPGNAQNGSKPSTNNTFAENTKSGISESAASQSKFDPKRYRNAQVPKVEDASGWGRKQQTVIPVRKPSKKQFVHAHPSPEYRIDAMPTITDEAAGEVYLLSADLDLPVDIENKVDMLNLVTAMTADGSMFLWAYKNSTNSWSQSARIAINEASQRWVRVTPDMSSNGYLLEFPMVDPPEPSWPPMTFTKILETAFGSRFIDTINHPQIKKLRGDYHV